MRHLSRKERGLGKHDAPLKIQWMKGYDAFIYGKIRNPYSSDTMLYREWERGFNTAYYDNIHRELEKEAKAFMDKRSREPKTLFELLTEMNYRLRECENGIKDISESLKKLRRLFPIEKK